MTRFELRRWWFSVHKWIGLVLAVLIVPLSLSGAALVWHDALDRVINPQRFAVTGAGRLPADAYAAAARARLGPGERVASLTLPDDDGPVVVSAAPAGAAARVRTNVWLDPPTARVLDMASSAAGPVRFLHVLHGSLQIPGVGRVIVGWLGVALLVSCVSGLWLWWPTVGRWTRGLRWRRRPEVDANLHHLLGFWVAVPLFVLSLTGVWISFPGVFGALVGEGGRPMRPTPARPAARVALPVDVVIAKAQRLAAGPVRVVTWPTEAKPDWSVRVGERTVLVADDEGLAVVAPERAGQGGVARLMRRIHDGDGMGPVWRMVIFVAGVLPAVLGVTGLLMWLRTRRWKTASRRPLPSSSRP